MKHLKSITFLLLLLLSTMGLNAQNNNPHGNAVVSEIKLYDMGGGVGILTVRVSGNQAHLYTGGSYTATGDAVSGGRAAGGIGSSSRFSPESPSPSNNGNSNGNQPVILTATVPLAPTTGNGPDVVVVDLRVEGEGGRVFWHWSFPVSTTNP